MSKVSLRQLATAATPSTAGAAAAPSFTRTRPLPPRKSHLFASHQNLLSTSPLLLFLRPTDFAAHEWQTLRANLLPLTPADNPQGGLKLTVLRPGLLPALLRDPKVRASIDTSLIDSPSHTKGPLAVLTAPDLHPPTLLKLLAVLNAASVSISRNAAPVDPKSKVKVEVVQRLGLLSALLEQRAFGSDQAKEVAKLPGLDVLRAQIVGLLSAPAAGITRVLGARGREVGRTLEGFKEGLKEGGEA